jgi:RNA-directed DNA polymerase
MGFEKIKTIADLAAFIPIKKQELTSLKPEENYRVFEVRKPGSDEKRSIETPLGNLKVVLERLADQFQWLYCDHKTDAAYGYVRAIATDPDKRNILTNAQKHLGLNYLVKVDFDNFFHQIDREKIRNLFNDYFLFPFMPETEDLLNRLVTYKDRLPMGSPTSPVLSNFATIGLDHELLYWCRSREITYTRYVDDLSFSSVKPLTNDHFNHLLSIMNSHRFVIDPKKTKWYGKNDIKEITGLIVGDKVGIPDGFIGDFEKSINKFHQVCSCAHMLPDHHVFDWIDKMKQVLGGQLNFVGTIYGRQHPLYLKLQAQLDIADDVSTDEESISWRYIGYELH